MGEGFIFAAGLGNTPWTVLAEGAVAYTHLSVGLMNNLISLLVLLLWIPLRQRPGLGTITLVLLMGTSMDVTLAFLPELSAVGVRLCAVVGGVLLLALGTGLYLGSALGPGPRDGLMVGLHRVTGRSLAVTRTVVELTVVAMGVVLGGTVGVGTLFFAFTIGSAVHATVRLLSKVPTTEL